MPGYSVRVCLTAVCACVDPKPFSNVGFLMVEFTNERTPLALLSYSIRLFDHPFGMGTVGFYTVFLFERVSRSRRAVTPAHVKPQGSRDAHWSTPRHRPNRTLALGDRSVFNSLHTIRSHTARSVSVPPFSRSMATIHAGLTTCLPLPRGGGGRLLLVTGVSTDRLLLPGCAGSPHAAWAASCAFSS